MPGVITSISSLAPLRAWVLLGQGAGEMLQLMSLMSCLCWGLLRRAAPSLWPLLLTAPIASGCAPGVLQQP